MKSDDALVSWREPAVMMWTLGIAHGLVVAGDTWRDT